MPSRNTLHHYWPATSSSPPPPPTSPCFLQRPSLFGCSGARWQGNGCATLMIWTTYCLFVNRPSSHRLFTARAPLGYAGLPLDGPLPRRHHARALCQRLGVRKLTTALPIGASRLVHGRRWFAAAGEKSARVRPQMGLIWLEY